MLAAIAVGIFFYRRRRGRSRAHASPETSAQPVQEIGGRPVGEKNTAVQSPSSPVPQSPELYGSLSFDPQAQRKSELP